MNTTENNKLIAEFMGAISEGDNNIYKIPDERGDDYDPFRCRQVLTFKEKANAIKEVIKWIELGKQDINNGFKEIDFILNKNDVNLEYNTSWDWLMPVLKKIDELDFDLEEDSNLIGDITHGLVSIDIEMTFDAVVEFIKWYNENNED
jgi:hypothetical protein